MERIIRPTPTDVVQLTARLVAERLRQNPDPVLGCATGRTVEGVYAELVRLHREKKLNLEDCRTFNLDEYSRYHLV